jgi:hypothetical protein
VITAVVELTNAFTWDPTQLTADVLEWPGEPDKTQLRDLAAPIAPDTWADQGMPVVRASSLDPTRGGVRRRSTKYQGAAFQVHQSGSGLVPGDVLVPMNPALPALMVNRDHIGALVSADFLALKAADGRGLWLWALLSSTSGRDFRAFVASDAIGPRMAKIRLLGLLVPIPPDDVDKVTGIIRAIEASTHRPEEQATETWWRTTDLAGADWSMQLAMRTPHSFDGDISLREFCTVEQGRHIPEPLRHGQPHDGARPRVDGGVLAGRPIRRWAESGTLVEPGDILVAAIGSRPHARIATEPMVADPNVFVLRLKDPEYASPLVTYLNGQDGYSRRQLLLTGTAIERLQRRRLEQFGVPPEALNEQVPEHSSAPLNVRLERALWP